MNELQLLNEVKRLVATLESIDRKLGVIAREMDTSGPNGSPFTMALGQIVDAIGKKNRTS